MDSKELFLLSENREIARSIIREILAEVEPEELSVAERYIDPLIDMASADEMATASAAQKEGGFGPVDLMVTVVVPVTVGVLTHLLIKFGESLVEKLREKLKDKNKKEQREIIVQLVDEQMERVVIRTRSAKGKRKSKTTKEVVIRKVSKLLTINE